jgi:hypothetical protein
MVKPRNIRIGNFQAEGVQRGRPNMDNFNKWQKDILNDPKFKDFDAYLWGSFPEKQDAKDVDILLTQGEGNLPTTEEMEELSIMNLEKSLVENNMLVDMGFTDGKIRPFNETMDIYKKTGKPVPTDGYVYGAEWFADDKRVKNRMSWKGPYAEEVGNNMVHLGGAIPYQKQIHSMDSTFNSIYGNKPLKIKERQKIHGTS